MLFCYMPYLSHPPITFCLVVPNVLVKHPPVFSHPICDYSETGPAARIFLNIVYESF
jgi:hypothetical protein